MEEYAKTRTPHHSTPLLDAVAAYAANGITRFHMPGHKGGAGAHRALKAHLGEAALACDVTGVEGLDDLHQPGGVIHEAQDLAAKAFGADHSFFLVNGTSAGVQAMILAACRPGDEIIVARNVHKSIIAGIILSGAQPVFVVPHLHPHFGLAMCLTPEQVAEALRRHPRIRAVLLINPTYYGVTADLKRIADLVHAQGKILLVDEAHGPHFRFHEELPVPALEAGADACAQGIHKILGGLTQASILHLKGDRLDPAWVQSVLRLIHTTSASYLLLASLDAARMQIATEGARLLEHALAVARHIREEVNLIPGLHSFGREITGQPWAHDLDPTKVTITVRDLGLSGQQVELILRRQYDIQVELSDLYNILLIVGFGNSPQEGALLVRSLGDLAARAGDFRDPAVTALLARAERAGCLPPLPDLAILPREAFFAPARGVALEEAAGLVSTEIITCYPPGMPIICPGERFTEEVIEHLLIIREAGFRVSGPRDPRLETVRVLAER